MLKSTASPSLVLRRSDAILFVVSAIVVGIFVLYAATMDEVGFPLDDSWIHQTYARNLGINGEWAFVPGEASAASTAPLYSSLLAIGHQFGLSPYLWAHSLGVLALFAGGVISSRLAERVFPTVPHVGLATGLLVVSSWHLIWTAASGMETMLFMTLTLWVIWLTWREIDAIPQDPDLLRRGLLLGGVGSLLMLTRPEGVVLLGLAGMFVLFSRTHSTFKEYMIWAVGVAIGFALIIVPYSILNYSLTERILPTTAGAKIAEYAEYRDQFIGLNYARMLIPLSAGAQLLFIPAIFAGLRRTWRSNKPTTRWLYFLPIVWAFVHLTLFVLRLPAPYQHGRYVIPILPPLLIFSAGGMYILVDAAKDNMLPRVLSRVLAISAILAVPSFVYLGGEAYGADVRIINTEMVKTAKWIEENIPPEELLAVHDIGAVGYFAPRPLIDLAGLVSPEIVPIIRDPAALMDYMCENNAEWLMVLPSQRPATEDDPRLELVFSTDEPYIFESGGKGNMKVYRLNFDEDCSTP